MKLKITIKFMLLVVLVILVSLLAACPRLPLMDIADDNPAVFGKAVYDDEEALFGP